MWATSLNLLLGYCGLCVIYERMLNNGFALNYARKQTRAMKVGNGGEKAVSENMYMTWPSSFLNLFTSQFCSQHIRMNKHQVLTRLMPSFLPRLSETESVLTRMLKQTWITWTEVWAPVNYDPFICSLSTCSWITNRPEVCSVYGQRLHHLTHNALLLISSSGS